MPMKLDLQRFPKLSTVLLLFGALSCGCSDDIVMRGLPQESESLSISADISQQASTRADESGFANKNTSLMPLRR